MNHRIIAKKTESILTIGEAFSMFITEKTASGLSSASLHNNEQAFSAFMSQNHISTDWLVNRINSQFIIDWKARQVNIMKASTLNHYISTMRVFLYWCMGKGYVPEYKITLVKGQETPIKFFSDDELQVLLKKPNMDNFVEHRTYTIICFILATGARASTISELTLDDVDYSRHEVIYRHLKNKQIATVPISITLEKVLHEFEDTWERSTDNRWLFCDVSEGQLTVSAIRQALEQYCVDRNVQPRGPHALRHNFARGWIQNNGNVFVLQKLLTHSTLDMSKKYVRLFSEDLHMNYESYAPLDSIMPSNSRTKTVKKRGK